MRIKEIVTETEQLNEIASFLRAAEYIWDRIPKSVKKKMPWGKDPETWSPQEVLQYLEITGNPKNDLENLINAIPTVDELNNLEKYLNNLLKTPETSYLLDLVRNQKEKLIKMNQSFIRPDAPPGTDNGDWRNL